MLASLGCGIEKNVGSSHNILTMSQTEINKIKNCITSSFKPTSSYYDNQQGQMENFVKGGLSGIA